MLCRTDPWEKQLWVAPSSNVDELWEYLWGKGIWHLFLWQNILYAFPNSRLTANLMSSHFWDVGSLPGIFRFQLRNKPTVCYVLRYHMWHIALPEAHCAAWASYSFPTGAGKGQWVFNTHRSRSSCLPQWREGGVEKHESARYQMLYHHVCQLLLVW